tara:strand:+ start:707 stop:1054 length:348 start_codon:yes stop_codon:yes gene_type:complete
MFEDHVADLFGLEFEEWMEKNHVISGGFVSWSEVVILPDDHPDHDKSLEEYMDDEETAVELIANNGHIIITLHSAKIVEKSDDFPEELIQQLIEMATTPLTKHQFLSDKQVGELE